MTGLVWDVMLQPFGWGRADCCTAACDVFAAIHGIDPMAPLRGQYVTRREALVEIRRRGGFEAMAVDLARDAGLQACDPRPGAIGVVRDPGGQEVLAICSGPRWFGKSETGVVSVRECLLCWSV